MKNNKGFTLIELLAVIVILAIIALIATPIVLNTINSAKEGAAIDSGYYYIESLQNSIATAMITNPDMSLSGTYDGENFTPTGSETSIPLTANYKGTSPKTVSLTFSAGKITGGTMNINGYPLAVDGSGKITLDRE